jgi:hypothetical protein
MAQGHYWVVTCKNTAYHAEKNPFHGHRIPFGKTDAHSPRPEIPDYIDIPCDDKGCGKTYSYTATEIIRWLGDATLLYAHPLFSLGVRLK